MKLSSEYLKNVIVSQMLQINKIRGFSLSAQKTEYPVFCVEETGPLSISEILYLSYTT